MKRSFKDMSNYLFFLFIFFQSLSSIAEDNSDLKSLKKPVVTAGRILFLKNSKRKPEPSLPIKKDLPLKSVDLGEKKQTKKPLKINELLKDLKQL